MSESETSPQVEPGGNGAAAAAGPAPARRGEEEMNDEGGFPQNRVTRAGVATIVVGFFVFVIGIFPSLINLDITPGIGIFQIFVALVGITFMTLGAYGYVYATRHRAGGRRLRESVGLRLMATGLVFAYVSGLADVLGIGTHPATPLTRPYLGIWQSWGIAAGVFIIACGVLLYSQRPRG